MKQIIINKTDLKVSQLCYGQMKLGIGNYPEENAEKMLDFWLDLGGNFIDTARAYSDWVPGESHRSERILGDYFKKTGKRNKFVICSKCCHYDLVTKEKRVNETEFMKDLEGSLKALQTDYIDLYLFHRDDTDVPMPIIMDFVEKARKQGKIRYAGTSNWTVARMQESDAVAASKHIAPFVADQMTANPGLPFSGPMHDTTMTKWDKNFADYHRRTGQLLMSCSSLANGMFDKVFDKEAWERSTWSIYHNQQFFDYAQKLKVASQESGLTFSQLCLRYTTDFPGVQGIPVFTASTEKHLKECASCWEHDIPQDVLPFF